MKKFLSIGSIAVSSLALSISAIQQVQAVNLVQNGGFTPAGTTVSAYLGNGVSLANWTFAKNIYDTSNDTGYNFIVPDGTAFATNVAAKGNAPFGGFKLYSSPLQTVNSQSDASGGAASGWYVAADAFFKRGAIQQTLTGLTAGKDYTVSFSQASGQQDGTNFTAPFTEYFDVGFGTSTKRSSVMAAAGKQPVSAWQRQSLTFTAGAADQVLSFLAQASNDVPPFALLSGISVEAVPTATAESVPEPENFVGTLIGLGFIATLVKSRLSKKKLDEQD